MGLINLGAGLSAFGGAIAETAGHLALEQQKSDLERQALTLSSQLASERQHQQNVESGLPLDVAAKRLSLGISQARYNDLYGGDAGPSAAIDGGAAQPPPTGTADATGTANAPALPPEPGAQATVTTAGTPPANPKRLTQTFQTLTSEGVRPLGMSEAAAKVLFFHEPEKYLAAVLDSYKTHDLRKEGEVIGRGGEGGGLTSLYTGDKTEPKTETREVNVGDEMKIAKFKDGEFVGYAKDNSGNEITAPRYKPPAATIAADDPRVNAWRRAVLAGNATMNQVSQAGGLRDAVAASLANATKDEYGPLAANRFSRASTAIISNFEKLPQYQLTANGLPYLQRIDAAMQTPGSVSDQDLLDSLTKLNTAGNAVTDAQVKLITDGKSFADMANTFANRFKNGGVLSPNQREQVQTIAKAIYANYQKGYQPVYDQVTKKLKESGIPEPFWSLPDLNNLAARAGFPNPGAASAPAAAGAESQTPPTITDLLNKYGPKQ